jgi:formylglycine-generating enzyme required for sulfatase activity
MRKQSILKTWVFALICTGSLTSTYAGEFEDRLRQAELNGDVLKAEAICKEWYQSGTYSPGILSWNYNALQSVEPNAWLFTQQESDTYPALLLQHALAVRKDITILGIPLLEYPNYRKMIIQRQNLHWIPLESSLAEFWQQFLNPPPAPARTQKPIYFGVMSNKNLWVADKARLYLTGLALKYSLQPFDNLALLRQNFEQNFRLDYLDLNLQPENDPELLARLNFNYVPALLLLHRQYSQQGATAKAERVQAIALKIANAAGRESEIKALFLPAPSATPLSSGIAVKNLDKAMRVVSPRLYAAETEVTHAQYDLFLQDLLKNKDFDQIALCRNDQIDWRSLLPEPLRNAPAAQIFANGDPNGPNNPVYNISHEAAQRYCTWITQVYNASMEKKRFKKVLFRLPTAAEWEMAAMGGRKDVLFPWGGPHFRNAKGCYLGNFKSVEPCKDCPSQGGDSIDGGFFSVPATSYFPNDFGLYCVAGNVAEMVQEFGISKGGSWQEHPQLAQIQTRGTYTQAAPNLGFRVFMEVIEE